MISLNRSMKLGFLIVLFVSISSVHGASDTGGDHSGGGSLMAKRFSNIGLRFFQAIADQCLAGAAGNAFDENNEKIEIAVQQLIAPEAYSRICGAVIFKPKFLRAFEKARVVPSSVPLLGTDQNPRDAINNRKDLITIGPDLWKTPAANMQEVELRLGFVAHEYFSLAQLEASDKYELSTMAVEFLSDAGVTEFAAIYGDLPIISPLKTFSQSATATVEYAKTRQALDERDPEHLFAEHFEEACRKAKKEAETKARDACEKATSIDNCRTVRFTVDRIEETTCDVTYVVGTYR